MKKYMLGFAVICHSGKDAKDASLALNGFLRDKLIVYTAKEYDKETEKFREVQHSIAPDEVSAPAINDKEICVTVHDKRD